MRWTVVLSLALAAAACQGQAPRGSGDPPAKLARRSAMELHSDAFKDGGQIPSKYTCHGANVSPPLAWSGVPQGAKSLALVVDDPDAPAKVWVHWVLYDLPAGTTSLPEGATDTGTAGVNDFKQSGYGGPCPPSGTHHYHFTLYALDQDVPLQAGATKDALLQAIKGHVLAQAELTGRYSHS